MFAVMGPGQPVIRSSLFWAGLGMLTGALKFETLSSSIPAATCKSNLVESGIPPVIQIDLQVAVNQQSTAVFSE
ncbi:hypothetical protein BDP81DRAFT_423340 [Colletotrichum phormii]|uniref:Uncharacterized protein n=1 Tax=Colletotrichum phormii TaxID=359342 RepID=A0AAI9ZVR4_9PEZI|nr:uncharacterized protein BDP81DRAFT_423340 [Colletotrichum phormii]KAK1639058.1 hypothetical protein BDP81DRAFT_423340 [Colletotrichum phormii]